MKVITASDLRANLANAFDAIDPIVTLCTEARITVPRKYAMFPIMIPTMASNGPSLITSSCVEFDEVFNGFCCGFPRVSDEINEVLCVGDGDVPALLLIVVPDEIERVP
jgi:hypothetical protein